MTPAEVPIEVRGTPIFAIFRHHQCGQRTDGRTNSKLHSASGARRPTNREAGQAADATGREARGQTRAAGLTMTDHFPGHRTYPTDAAVFEQLEAVATAVAQLHDAMTAMRPEYRWLGTSMMGDELGDILRMIQVDQQEFTARNLRDLSPLITVTPVAGSPTA